MPEPKPVPSLASRFSLPWRTILITLAILAAGILIQSPVVSEPFPSGDDSGYLFDGVRLVEHGTLMPLGSGTLAGMLNGAVYAFFPRDHMLLGAVSEIRRGILLAAIFLAVGLAGSAIGGRRAGWAAMLVAIIARPTTTALWNTADSLYTALSGLAFAVLLLGWMRAAKENRTISNASLAGAGLLLGIGALARLDGLLLGLMLIPVLWFLRGRNRLAAKKALTFAAGFAIPVILFVLIYRISSGSWDPQIGQRSYLAFEQGHNALYSGHFEVVPATSAADLYGTAEENGYSVLRAIARNPQAFAARIPLVLANAARLFFDAYSILGGVLFLFLVAGGLAALWPREKRPVMVFALLWCVPLAGYLLASYRSGFFCTVFPQLLTLAIAGALTVLAQFRTLWRSGQAPLLLVWALTVAGVLAAQAQFAVGQFQAMGPARQSAGEFQGWLSELAAQVPPGECVITFNAEEAIYSNHAVCGKWQMFFVLQSPQELAAQMTAVGARYLVVGADMRTLAPEFVPLVTETLTLQYISRDGSREIYRMP